MGRDTSGVRHTCAFELRQLLEGSIETRTTVALLETPQQLVRCDATGLGGGTCPEAEIAAVRGLPRARPGSETESLRTPMGNQVRRRRR